jgi:hypothetical protein
MAKTVKPPKPVENWEQVRDEWVAEVNRFVSQVEAWAERQGWGTLRDEITITESRIGRYQVPALLIHTMKGRLLLSPQARYVIGAEGLMDLDVYPSFDRLISIVKTPKGWQFKSPLRGLGAVVTETSFVRMVRRLQEPR